MQNWLVTGVSSGLGREIARLALARGDTVTGAVRKEPDRAAFEALAPGRARGLIVDLAEPEAASAAVKEVGPVDVLVNNAGYGLVGAVEEASLDELRTLFEVNVIAALALIQAVAPAMRARRSGRIVNITSVSGLAVWAGTGPYCASKHALEALGETLADEIAPLGVAVINVAPGAMRTGYAGRSLIRSATRIDDYDVGPAHQAETILADHAGQEAGDPAKMAAAVLAAVDMETPPRRLLLGADALHYAEAHIEGLAADIARWREISLSTAF